MRKMFQRLKWGISVTAFYLFALSAGAFIEECGQREGIYIASKESCSQYIFCYGEDSFMDECDEDNPYFSEIDQTCDSDPNVCDFNGTQTSKATEKPLVTTTPRTTTKSRPITTTSSVASTDLVTTTVSTPVATSVTTMASHLAATQCPSSDDPNHIIFLADSQSCTSYFMCYHGEPLAMQCSNELLFDRKAQKCDFPENVQCELDSSTSARENCRARSFGAFSHPWNCNYYFLCRFGYLMVMQCPQNADWDYEKKMCVRRGQAKCYASSSIKINGRM